MVRTPFVLALLGSSLTTGRLSSDWVPRLTRDLQTYPEAKGPIRIYNLGKGSQTSAWGLTQVPLIVGLEPTHILFEGFGINDCVDFGGGPAISRAQHIINIQDMVSGFQAGIPGVDLTIQTMNPVSSTGVAIRPTLADYYADEIATGTTLGIRTIDNLPSWTTPLPLDLTYGALPGFSPWDVATTWNPAAKNANITLSGGNLAMASASANCAVLGTVGRSSGKYTFRVVATSVAATSNVIGIGKAAMNLADGAYVGSDANAYGYTASGTVWNNGSVATILGNYIAGSAIDVAVDFTALKIWFAKDNIWMNGDPITGTGGLSITAGTYFPAASAANTGVNTASFPLTSGGDGLHPVWAGGVDTYLYPTILSYARARMAALWP